MYSMMSVARLALFLGIFLGVSACTRGPVQTEHFGPLSATGTLIRADVSLIRRGTHALVIDGKTKYFVESRTQNLRDFEGRTVNVSGALQPNSEKTALPVLVAELVAGPRENEDLLRTEIPSVGLRLGAPKSWESTLTPGGATFSLAGESEPLLILRLMSGSTLPAQANLFIKNRRASRIESPGGAKDVFILDGKSLIQLHFDAATQRQLRTKEDADIASAQFERVISTISFLTDREAPVPMTGSGSGTPCGGVGGAVCPSGYYCNIQDLETRTGSCRKR